MVVFRKKKKDWEEEYPEQRELERIEREKREIARLRGEAQRTRALREAKIEKEKLRRQISREKHPVVHSGKSAVERIAGAGKEVLITTLTSRRIGPGQRAGTGTKYRRSKSYRRPRGSRLPEGPTAPGLGRGHRDPNLYDMQSYGEEMTPTSRRVDYFGEPRYGGEDLLGMQKKESILVGGSHSLDLIGESKKKQKLF